jgi:hypothetical protein
MATNIDKALYQTPTSMEENAQEEHPLEIEVVDPEELNIHADGLDIHMEKKEPSVDDFDANLAEFLDPSVLQSLGAELSDDVDADKASRKDWEKAYTEGLKLLGLQYEERTEPWNGACGVFHPMITEAVVRFQSESITETFPAAGPVKTKIIGKQTPDIQASAMRVENDLNYELTEVMKEFRPEHERMLWSLPATGSAFKKVYYDPALGRQVSMFIPAEDIILPYGATDLDTCYRVTHVMRRTENDLKKMQVAGFYVDAQLGDPDKSQTDIQKAKDKETGFSANDDGRYTLYESHVDLVIAEDPLCDKDDEGEPIGIALPYVVTLIKGTNTVLSIRRNWKEDDDLRLKRQHFVHYQYIPGFGAYGFGLFHLIGGYAKSATSLMRQLVDAGTLSNLPGGLKSRGLRIKGDDTPIAPGEWRDVDVGSGAIKDSILPLPYKEPSIVLSGLLDKIVDEGRRFAATADFEISDMSAQAPVGTTLALIERQLKVMSAVQARMHYSFKQELNLLVDIIKDYSDPDYDYDPDDKAPRKAKMDDYDNVDIIPVSDPNAATMSQRVVQYQAVMQMAQMAPNIYDLPKLHRGMLEVLGIKNADKLVPLPDDQKPRDPVSENQAVLKGEPLKAFFYQDHQAHIAVHQSMMQDPLIAQLVGQSPNAAQMTAAMQAHIAEHVGFLYRQQIEQHLGMPLPPEDEKLPPQIETALSGMMAQAAQQVLQQSQAAAAQQQAQQNAMDPVIQMQQQELQIKQQEVQLKQQEMQARMALEEKKLQIDAAMKADRMHLDEKKLQVDAAVKADQLHIQQQGNNPELDALRNAHELAAEQHRTRQELTANAQRHQQEMAMAQQKLGMAAQQHAQGLAQKAQIHQQDLAQKRAQHRAQLELQKKQAAQQPKEKPKE